MPGRHTLDRTGTGDNINLTQCSFSCVRWSKHGDLNRIKMSKILTLVYMTFLSLVSVNAEATNYNGEEAFTFDYHRLRVGGLILAAVLCLIGITILLSGHCRCKFNQNKRRRTGSNAQQMLNDQGRACDC
uniref:FXYD domain-containing ion transport regulator n=2 Tax=Poecilia reticulata TaxID=8081 RepID=A0A3P9PFG4_POERE